MINHKYLTDLGIDPTDIASNFYEQDKRAPKWAEQRIIKWAGQRSIYGFDERETWSLDATFYQWLYERLMMYKETNCADLSFHEFEYNREQKTQEQLIDLMIEYLKIALLDDNFDFDEEKYNKVMEISKIWAIVLPAMWW